MCECLDSACDVVKTPQFHMNVQVVVPAVAAKVMVEDPETPGHARRVNRAIKALDRLVDESRKVVFLICTLGHIEPDADYETLFDAIFTQVDVLAGVFKMPIPVAQPIEHVVVPPRAKPVLITEPIKIPHKRTFFQRLFGLNKESK